MMRVRYLRIDATNLAAEDVLESQLGWLASSRRSRSLVLQLAPTLYQRRTLRGLPPTSRRHLQALVQENVARFFPRAVAGLVTDALWSRAQVPARPALAVAADAKLLACLIAQVEQRGGTVEDVVPTGDDELRGLSLLPPAARKARSDRERRSLIRTGMLTAILALLASTSHTLALTRALSRAEREVASSAPRIERTQLQRLAHARRAEVQAIAQERAVLTTRAAVMLEAIAAVSDSLAIDLHSLTFSARASSRMEFIAPDASVVVEAIQRLLPIPAWVTAEGPTFVEVAGERWSRVTIEQGTGPT